MNKDSDLECIFHEHTMEIISKTQEFQERDSGWFLIKLIRLEINVNQYTWMAGSSFIPLPRFLLTKKAIVNVCNENKEERYSRVPRLSDTRYSKANGDMQAAKRD